MSLKTWKIIVLGLIASILLLSNIVLVADWPVEHRVAEYLTGTAVTIIVVLLILLVGPKAGALVRRCPVCDHVLMGRGKYCGERGSRV